LFIVGTVAGIAGAVIAGPLLSGSDFLINIATNANSMTLGALCILTMGLALALVPVVIFPILRRFSEVLALGYVIFRGALETFTYLVTVISWLVLIGLSQGYRATLNDPSVQVLGQLLLKTADICAATTTLIFPLGAMMLYVVFYQYKLIPRWISGWGIVAAVLTLVPGLTGLFGLNLDVLKYVMLPQEMVMAVWLIAVGFNPSAIVSETERRTVL
jgi:hypothetical protein